MGALLLITGDQLSPQLASLKAADRQTDTLLMVEVAEEAQSCPASSQKASFYFFGDAPFCRAAARKWLEH